jgi:hypothetical protein
MNEEEIKVGVVGKILEGYSIGWFLLIKDKEKSGGYLILISKDPNMSKYAEGYDYWAEDKEKLINMIREFKWKVKWGESETSDSPSDNSG